MTLQMDQWAQHKSTALWWRDAGIDALVDEKPRNWLAEPAARKARQEETDTGKEANAAFAALPDLHAHYAAADALPDGSRKARRILPAGDPAQGLMIIIDMPDKEDSPASGLLSGEPGRLFDRMMAAIGRTRDSLYLTSIMLERPAGGIIDPERMCAAVAMMKQHIALAAPRRVLVMGDTASRALLGVDLAHAGGKLLSLNQERGTVGAVATFAPWFLMRHPARKQEAWRDLQILAGGLDR